MPKLALFTSLIIILVSNISRAEEYMLSPVREGAVYQSPLYSRQSMPNLFFSRKCDKEGRNCRYLVENQSGRRITSFSGDDSVTVLARGRYTDRALMLILHSYSGSGRRQKRALLVNDTGRVEPFSVVDSGSAPILDAVITLDKQYLILSSDGILLFDRNGALVRMLKSNVKLTGGIVRNNPEGDIEKGIDELPPSFQAFSEESLFSFLVGGGVANIDWIAGERVSESAKEENKTFASVDYVIPKTLFYLTYFEGRVGNTRLTVAYLQNMMEKAELSHRL